MTITRPVYATREMVKRSLDIADTVRANAQIDRLLQSCSVSIDGSMHRIFYPRLGTFKRDWPGISNPTPWRVWLDDEEVIELLTFSSGGVSLSVDDLLLYPDDGPPFNRVELDISANSSFSLGGTHQYAVVGYGLLGYTLDLKSIGGLVVGINDNITALIIPDGSAVGVGDLLKIEDEYLLATGRGWIDSTQNLQADLTALASSTTLAVTDGTAFFADEIVLLDAEKMLITDIAGNNLIVKRAWDGSTLAEHSGSDIYVSRSISVDRASVGSTAASHLMGVTVNRWVPPALVNQLCIGETLAALEQERSAYARVVGSGETASEARGVGLEDLRVRACEKYGRKSRHRAV